MSQEGKENLLAKQPVDTGPEGAPGLAGPLNLAVLPSSLKWVVWFTMGSAAFTLVLYLIFYAQTGIWQLLVLAGFVLIALVVGGAALVQLDRGKISRAGYLMMLAFGVAYGGSELVLAGGTLYLAVGSIFLILLAGIIFIPGNWPAWLAASTLLGVYFWLVNTFEPVPRYDITGWPGLRLFIIGVTAVIIAGALWQLVRMLRTGTIRARLTLAFELIVLLPAIIIIVVSVGYGLYTGQQQVIRQLESVVALKEVSIQEWVQGLQLDMEVELTQESGFERMKVVLEAAELERTLDANFERLVERQWLLNRFRQTIDAWGKFQELFLLNSEGRVVLSSDSVQEGKIYRGRSFFQEGLKGFYLQPPLYSPPQRQVELIAAIPVTDEQGQVIGVLAGRIGLDRLNEIMSERRGLGETGETYLVGANHALLTDSRFEGYERSETYVHTDGVNVALTTRGSGSGAYDDYRDVPVIGVFRWLPELQVVLAAEQEQAEAFAPTYTALGINGGVTVAAILLAGIAALFITQSIANPLVNLADTARQIADGNLTLTAPIEREDEVGTLAQAFNSMTGQLRGLIDSLEDQVASRTRRLEIVAILSERLNAILNLQDLLQELVNQIQQTFGYYHAHIYLLDPDQENLVVAAGTGQAGTEMKARGHSIPVNAATSLVARAARTRQIVRVDNVREAEGWLPNPLLPDTYCEMAVPIVLDDRVVGVLDVQENEVSGLDEGDASLLRSLANQVAVAIRNARLFAGVETALAEARATQERYEQQAWDKVRQSHLKGEYHYQRPGAPALAETELIPQAAELGQITIIDDRPEQAAVLAPIKLQDQVIGLIQLHELGSQREWTEQDLDMIQAVADQAAQVAENIRLFGETQERASREQLMSQISDRMRRAPDLESLMQTAVSELSRVLGPARTFVRFGLEQPPEVKASSDHPSGPNGQA